MRLIRVLVLALIALPALATEIVANQPVPVSPGGRDGIARVEARCPTFSWSGVGTASGYELAAWRIPQDETAAAGLEPDGRPWGSTPVIHLRLPAGASSWTAWGDYCLERGSRYAWVLGTLRGGAEAVVSWSEARIFEVAAAPSVSELEQALEVVRGFLGEQRETTQREGELEEAGRVLFPSTEVQSLAGGPEPAAAENPLTASVKGLEVQGAGDTVQKTFGVHGYTSSRLADSAGVVGESLNTQSLFGAQYGVYGRSFATADDSAGVFGVTGDDSSSGTTYGVYGFSGDTTTDSAGVYGFSSTTGSRGVFGEVSAMNGWAVLGWATAGTGSGVGVYGLGASAGGQGGHFSNLAGGQALKARSSGTGATLQNVPVVVQNEAAGSDATVLALQFTGTAKSNLEGNHRFITFWGSDGIAGKVVGAANSVVYQTTGADFAEYFPRVDLGETLEPGDVVGLSGHGVSLGTGDAVRIFVVSSRPAVLGGDPGDDRMASFAPIALMGRVPVKVWGAVQVGDLLIASGYENGTAVGVAPADLTVESSRLVIGRALEAHRGEGAGRVEAIVGLDDPASLLQLLARKADRLESLEKRVERLEKK